MILPGPQDYSIPSKFIESPGKSIGIKIIEKIKATPGVGSYNT